MLPAAVSSLRCPTRSSSGTPSSSSSCLTALLTVGCVAETTLAAWENPPCLTTSTKNRSLRKSMSILIWNSPHALYSFLLYVGALQDRTHRCSPAARSFLTPALRTFRSHQPMSSQDDFALKISALARLSRREREVLAFVDQGKTRTDIAARLHLSPKTVDAYRSRILAKL